MKKIVLFILGAIVLTAVACAPTPANQILCPINYDITSAEDCQVNVSDPKDGKHELLPALELQQNQIAIYQPPGDRAAIVEQGIGFHSVPARYSAIFPNNLRTVKTERNSTDTTKCPKEMQDYGECNTPLDRVVLKGGVNATVDYEIDLLVNVNANTVSQLAKIGSYAELVKRFNSFTRTEFRKAASIDPQLAIEGTLTNALEPFFLEKLSHWDLKDLVTIQGVRVRSAEPDGFAPAANEIQSQQGAQHASAFATQQATACSGYKEEAWRAYCMAVFIWSQKNDGSTPPQPPLPIATPADTPKP